MARIVITIETGNAAFCDPETGDESPTYEALEVGAILAHLATDMRHDGAVLATVISDDYGNRVGAVTVEN